MTRKHATLIASVVGTSFVFFLVQNPEPLPPIVDVPAPSFEKRLTIHEDIPRHDKLGKQSFREIPATTRPTKNGSVSEEKAGNTTWDGGTRTQEDADDTQDVVLGARDEDILLQERLEEKELGIQLMKARTSGLYNVTEHFKERKNRNREDVFAERRRKVAEVCKNSTENLIPSRDIYSYRKLMYISDYKFMWCPVLKAGSTVWMRNLKTLLNVRGNREKIRESVSDKSSIDKKILLKKYFTFMIVRHPLDRLLSAYRDKMLRNKNKRFLEIQNKMVTKYRPKNSAIKSKHPTFTEFLQNVRDDMRENRKKQENGEEVTINQHWEPYWSSCSPCQIDYDAILKIETMSIDQEYVIKTLRLGNKIKNSKKPATPSSDKYKTTQEATVGYFSEVPLALLQEVVKEYQGDFDIFGYSPEEYLDLAKPNR